MTKPMDYKKARELLLNMVSPAKTEICPLSECASRVLAQEIRAEGNIPPFDRSAYDGYAFRAADTASASEDNPVTLRILEEVAAGAVPSVEVTAGTAVKILTGAPIPCGADAVIMFEKTRFTDETVTLSAPVKAGSNIVKAGEDVQAGQLLAQPGDRVDAGMAGTLASQAVSCPLVYRRLRVGIFSTGNEVIEIDAPMAPGKIRNSNRYTLEAALIQAGMEPVWLGSAGDCTEDIAGLIRGGLDSCDALVGTGGVSAGDYDLTPDAMEAAGVSVLVRGVDLKPGMACAYGVKGQKLVCALSGNPASAVTNFYAVALPILKKMAGDRKPLPEEIELTLGRDFGKSSRNTRLIRGRLVLSSGTAVIDPPADQGNVVLSSTIGCNVMAIVPAGSGPLSAGTKLKGFMI